MAVADALLPQAFCAEDALVVAPLLLGKRLSAGRVRLRITEVEAYPPGDTASHCRHGRTARNAPMWGAPGHAYIYLCYGIHRMLNVVTNAEGQGAAVLIRSCEVERGEAIVRERRGGLTGPALLTGPGKVAAALGLDLDASGVALFQRGGLCLLDGPKPAGVLVGPRVGIDYAEPEDVRAAFRFAVSDSAWVSMRKTLQPR